MPPYDELVLIASAKNADVRLGAFATAMEKAAIWLTNHPAEGWESFKKAYPKLDDELNRRLHRHAAALRRVRPRSTSPATSVSARS